MKTLITLLLATTISSTVFAYDEGRITISVAAKKNVLVVIDGRQYSDDDNSFVLNDIQPGNHSIRIFKVRKNGNGGKNNGRNENGRHNDRDDLLYSSNVYVKPSTHVDIMINRFGKALVDERPLARHNHRDDDWDNGGYDDYNRAMNDREFSQLVDRIRSAWFNSGKMNTAKDAFQRSYFTTVQVRQIIQIFSMESDKLELAKLAYRNTVDRRNYYQLFDVFSFQSSREELEKFIRDGRY